MVHDDKKAILAKESGVLGGFRLGSVGLGLAGLGLAELGGEVGGRVGVCGWVGECAPFFETDLKSLLC